MNRRSSLALAYVPPLLVLSLAAYCGWSTAASCAEPKDSTTQKQTPSPAVVNESEAVRRKREQHMRAMRNVAEKLRVTSLAEKDRANLELIGEPLFRFNDSAREFHDGSMWGWGKPGRPEAVLCLSLMDSDPSGPRWLFEINSLSSGKVAADGIPNVTWPPREPGLDFKAIPNAPEAESTEAKRLRQLKDLARRFSGFERFRKENANAPERYELRLLPQPIYRYSNPKRGQVDGALFLMTYGTNPEVLLVIELQQSNQPVAEWKYGLTRISYAEPHVLLDDREVWTQPHLAVTSVNDIYRLTVVPFEIPDDRQQAP